ncbi:MAG: protein serine/threonine phosphatase 2C family protein [Candidatus Pacebacteria bacterium]|nr:protein serine/threonine phosphatase 2C family protein [Candidatus Paceibacterota bacterium]
MRYEVSSCSLQGRRSRQEDRVVVSQQSDGILLAIMDGHGGAGVSEFCKKHLVSEFVTQCQKHGQPADYQSILTSVVAGLHVATQNRYSGSTISIVFVTSEGVAHVAVLGDSPVVIKDHSGRMIFSPEHNVGTNPKERESALRRGAVEDGPSYVMVRNSQDSIQLSRSLGDRSFPFLNREPDLMCEHLTSGSFVLVGSDGLFDGVAGKNEATTHQIVEIASGGEFDAKAICTRAYHEHGSEDNVSAIVLRVTE